MEHWTRLDIDNGVNVDVVYTLTFKRHSITFHTNAYCQNYNLGLTGNMVLNWIANFLSNRRQRVVVHGMVTSYQWGYPG